MYCNYFFIALRGMSTSFRTGSNRLVLLSLGFSKILFFSNLPNRGQINKNNKSKLNSDPLTEKSAPTKLIVNV